MSKVPSQRVFVPSMAICQADRIADFGCFGSRGDGGFGEVDDEQRLLVVFGREGVVVQVDDGGMQRLVFR